MLESSQESAMKCLLIIAETVEGAWSQNVVILGLV